MLGDGISLKSIPLANRDRIHISESSTRPGKLSWVAKNVVTLMTAGSCPLPLTARRVGSDRVGSMSRPVEPCSIRHRSVWPASLGPWSGGRK